MLKLRFDVTGPDALLLARLLVFFQGLFVLPIFKIRPENHSQEILQAACDLYQQKYEKGKFGDRNEIRERVKARKDIVEKVQKVLRFLESVCEERDIPALLNIGVQLRKTPKKRAQKSQQQVTLATAGGDGSSN